MKKFSIIFAVLAFALAFTSCEDDKTPVAQKPTKFVLNTPPLADQTYELTPDGTLKFTVSQADYGFVASATYGIQIALTEEQKAEPMSLASKVPTSAVIEVSAKDMSEAMCKMLGITEPEQWADPAPMKVFVRATSMLGAHESSFIASNWITLSAVKPYYAVPKAAEIYLVGSPEGWVGPTADKADHYADWILSEKSDEIGSKVFYGTFEMPAAPMFRFYTALTGWDADSYGSQVDDNPIDVELDGDGLGTFKVVKGKGSYNFTKFNGGSMQIVVNMADPKKMEFTVLATNN